MAPPNPIQCSVPTCNFSTPENTPTWEMMTNLLKVHTDAVHSFPSAQAAPGATSAKLKKLPRPDSSHEMREAEWNFKEQSWKAYMAYKWKRDCQSKCTNCGYSHGSRICPAKGQICLRCHKIGHFKAVCRSRHVGKSQGQGLDGALSLIHI